MPFVFRQGFARKLSYLLQPDSLSCKRIQMRPNKGQLSRWRFLVDGTLGLYSRRKLQQLGGALESVRYLMVDACSQHGREFEHVMVLEIPPACLVSNVVRRIRSCSIVRTLRWGRP